MKFGLDEPYTILRLFLYAMLALSLAFVGMVEFHYDYPLLSWLFFAVLFLIALLYLSPMACRVWSSKVGKQRLVKRLIGHLKLKGNEIVLDCGCGSGVFLIECAKQLSGEGKAIGIDLWRKASQAGNSIGTTLRNAALAQVADRVELHTADMCQIPLPDNSVDVVVACLSIHHIEKACDRIKAVQEISRVTKPGGKVMLIDYQYTKEYMQALFENGWTVVSLSKKNYAIFPPVRIVRATKP